MQGLLSVTDNMHSISLAIIVHMNAACCGVLMSVGLVLDKELNRVGYWVVLVYLSFFSVWHFLFIVSLFLFT